MGEETLTIGCYPIDALSKPFFFLHADWLKDALLEDRPVIKKTIHQVMYTQLILYTLKHPLQVFRLALSRLGFAWNSGST